MHADFQFIVAHIADAFDEADCESIIKHAQSVADAVAQPYLRSSDWIDDAAAVQSIASRALFAVRHRLAGNVQTALIQERILEAAFSRHCLR